MEVEAGGAEAEIVPQQQQEEDEVEAEVEVELSHHTDQSYGKIDTPLGTESENEPMVIVDAPNPSSPGNNSMKSTKTMEKNDPKKDTTPQEMSPKINPKNLFPDRKEGQPVNQINSITGKLTPTQTITRTGERVKEGVKEHNTGGAQAVPMELENRGKRVRGAEEETSTVDAGGKKNKEKDVDRSITAKPLKEMWPETAKKHQNEVEEKEKGEEEKNKAIPPRENAPKTATPQEKQSKEMVELKTLMEMVLDDAERDCSSDQWRSTFHKTIICEVTKLSQARQVFLRSNEGFLLSGLKKGGKCTSTRRLPTYKTGVRRWITAYQTRFKYCTENANNMEKRPMR